MCSFLVTCRGVDVANTRRTLWILARGSRAATPTPRARIHSVLLVLATSTPQGLQAALLVRERPVVGVGKHPDGVAGDVSRPRQQPQSEPHVRMPIKCQADYSARRADHYYDSRELRVRGLETAGKHRPRQESARQKRCNSSWCDILPAAHGVEPIHGEGRGKGLHRAGPVGYFLKFIIRIYHNFVESPGRPQLSTVVVVCSERCVLMVIMGTGRSMNGMRHLYP